jgi:superoxide dismutase, Fe-Mn family
MSFFVYNLEYMNNTLNTALAMPALSYSFNQLEPYLDAKTLEIHHTKHHQTYLNNLNKLIEANQDLWGKSLEQILTNLNQLPLDLQTPVLNNAGQVYNHNKYFENLSPIINQKPSASLTKAIVDEYGSLEKFLAEFKQAGLTQFGSGWVFLILDETKGLEIIKSSNANSPITSGITPLITMDVWEHAYYLNYQNRRGDYIDGFFQILNWELVSQNYQTQLSLLSTLTSNK